MAEERKPIKNALISVFHKDHLEPIIKKLDAEGVEIYSTGGTKTFIEKTGITAKAVEDLTSYPSILGGRVKTLHPKVFGGILSRRENGEDQKQIEQYDIPEFDLVVVDLYPFEQTVAGGGTDDEIIEKIDIGGISLIRAAAKNHKDVTVISSQNDYAVFEELLRQNGATTSLEERKAFAARAFDVTSHYDSAIYGWFAGEGGSLKISESQAKHLRYGENPHQNGVFYGNLDELLEQLHGKELSYNNLLDVDAAVQLISEFDETTFAVIKHNNACGLASRPKLVEAYKDALAGDPVSAFGGVMVTNKKVDVETAEEINNIFFEVIIAPGYDDEALKVLQQKKNRVILLQKAPLNQDKQVRSVLNGILAQDRDTRMERAKDLTTATKAQPSKKQIEDLLFANIIAKHTKSNTIVLAKNKQLLGSGTGQTSRVDALRHAVNKAKSFNFDLLGAVMASDAFFPFPDCVEIADNEGIKAVIQPGGSKRDSESVEYCNKNNMAMVMTGIRHFKH